MNWDKYESHERTIIESLRNAIRNNRDDTQFVDAAMQVLEYYSMPGDLEAFKRSLGGPLDYFGKRLTEGDMVIYAYKPGRPIFSFHLAEVVGFDKDLVKISYDTARGSSFAHPQELMLISPEQTDDEEL